MPGSEKAPAIAEASNIDNDLIIPRSERQNIAKFTERLEKSIATPKSESPPDFIPSEGGLADRLIHRYPQDFKHVPGLGWFCWSGTHWANDDRFILRAAKQETESLFREAKDLLIEAVNLEVEAKRNDENIPSHIKEKKAKAKELVTLAKKQNSDRGHKGIVAVASNSEEYAADFDLFNRSVYLLNCENLTVNVKSGKPHKHKRTDFITRKINVNYNPDATCPRWNQFLNEIMLGDQELISYLQRVMGLCLTGHCPEQAFFVLWGSGRNGKSTFMNVIQELLGDYAREMDSEVLLSSKTNPSGPSEQLVRLAGIRLATANETDQGRKLAESRVKALTGNDTVTARAMYAKNSIEFKPEFKLFLRTNHKPRVDGSDAGIWRRIKLIPFEAEFLPQNADPELFDTLREELPGILNWAIAGYHNYLQVGGLVEPEKVKTAVDEYRQEQDSLSMFIIEEGLNDVSYYRDGIRATEFNDRYRTWAELNECPTLSAKAIAKKLEQMGWRSEKSRNGAMKYPPRLNPSQSVTEV